MRIKRHSQNAHTESHGIDLAPMLDFVINLLIFFIITAVFVKESSLIVNRPTDVDQPEKKNEVESIRIQILNDGSIWMDNRVIDPRAVRPNVERLSAAKSDSGVLIIAQEGAPNGVVVKVVDQVHLGGIYDITFTTTQ
ncbi:MAG TPA: biopolymer transporter ExbD [Gammaproteobacteria bacterium]|nr:biopolymer transporter ExbD [Gammaproteobacteria bacterium]